MKGTNWNQAWTLNSGKFDFFKTMMPGQEPPRVVNLPHDFMIESEVSPDAASGPAMGYYKGGICNYTKMLDVPEEWKEEQVYLSFDGVMGNATVEVNGSFAALHHYGYTPFLVDITPYVTFGAENRVTVTVNASMQPSSRWYSGAGIYRDVELFHAPKIHIAKDGIYAYTERVSYEGGKAASACVIAEVTIENHTDKTRVVTVEAAFAPEGEAAEETAVPAGAAIPAKEPGAGTVEPAAGTVEPAAVTVEPAAVTVEPAAAAKEPAAGTVEPAPGTRAAAAPILIRHASVAVNPHSTAVARIRAFIPHPVLWDAEHPNLYTIRAAVQEQGVFTTHLIPAEQSMADEAEVLFGIRTIHADAVNGLLVNEQPVKLKGGCIHHDNGILGAVSLYDSEYRKLKKLKEVGYNAVRMAHNPASAQLLEACDRVGMYVIDEAFDCWAMGKQPGDYSQFFAEHWKEDMRAFILRDRCHPSILFWSTGNEIFERGGLGNGYTLANELIDYVRSLDQSRLVTNGFCSYWSGQDDIEMRRMLEKMMAQASGSGLQNADAGTEDTSMEDASWPFVNNLDVVGYNYLDSHYELAGKLYPERVIVGTESFPKEMDKVWDYVERLPYVIGDFTWTSYDYIGEAGIGKTFFFDKDESSPDGNALSSHTSEYPWRLANDADLDINGELLPQGHYRRILWGSDETYICSYDPAVFGKEESVSGWGWPGVSENWNWPGQEGKMARVLVYSAAEEVELLVNGKAVGREKAGRENRFTASFALPYEKGVLEAVSFREGKEVSRGMLSSTGEAVKLRLVPERTVVPADGQSLVYVGVELVDENGLAVTDASVPLTAAVEGNGVLAGFGSGNPVTEENYTSGAFTSYHGRCMAVLRSTKTAGTAVLKVSGPGMETTEISVTTE